MTEIEFIATYSRIRDYCRMTDQSENILNAKEIINKIYFSADDVQNDAVELAICAIGIFINAGGDVQSLQRLAQQKLEDLRTRFDITGFYKDQAGNHVEVRKLNEGSLYQGFNVSTDTTYCSPCPKVAMKSLLSLFEYTRV